MSDTSITTAQLSASVLLVDDDVELVGLLRDYLASDGFSVAVAHDGESALWRFAAQAPDIAKPVAEAEATEGAVAAADTSPSVAPKEITVRPKPRPNRN